MITYIVDIVIVLVLAFFAWRGARKGLILTLFSLLAIFVAFYGAKAMATNFSKPVANIIRPSIQLTIDGVLTGETPEAEPAPSPGVSEALGAQESSDLSDELPAHSSDFTLQQILDLLDESGRFSGLRDYLEEAIEEKTLEITTTAAAAISAYLAQLIATVLLFGLSFVAILLIWFLVSRALDLAFKLPILSAINALGGLLFGLIKGVLVILVLVWLARLAGLITDANAGPVASLMTVDRLGDLLRSLMAGPAANSSAEAEIYQTVIHDMFINI